MMKQIPWNKGKKGVQVGWCKGLNKNNDVRLAKLSEDRKGMKNPFYTNKDHPGVFLESTRHKQSQTLKKRILDGSFTPNTQNRNTHWKLSFRSKKFRSSWEVCFYALTDGYEYEKLRLKYYDSQQNKERIVIIDFVNHVAKTLVEVKPVRIQSDQNSRDKMKSVNEWALNNGYSVSIVDENWIVDNIDDIRNHPEISDEIKKMVFDGIRYFKKED